MTVRTNFKEFLSEEIRDKKFYHFWEHYTRIVYEVDAYRPQRDLKRIIAKNAGKFRNRHRDYADAFLEDMRAKLDKFSIDQLVDSGETEKELERFLKRIKIDVNSKQFKQFEKEVLEEVPQ